MAFDRAFSPSNTTVLRSTPRIVMPPLPSGTSTSPGYVTAARRISSPGVVAAIAASMVANCAGTSRVRPSAAATPATPAIPAVPAGHDG
jgi:hypothetical protein